MEDVRANPMKYVMYDETYKLGYVDWDLRSKLSGIEGSPNAEYEVREGRVAVSDEVHRRLDVLGAIVLRLAQKHQHQFPPAQLESLGSFGYASRAVYQLVAKAEEGA